MTTPNTYDQLPYNDLPFAQTHPDRLHSIAALRGLSPAAVTSCRVLELGCAGANNLLPMAEALPNSHFLGIDLSLRQIESARALASELKLTNIDLRHADLMDLNLADLGQFDYIIAHGLYSWVPEPVREKILELCSRALTPHGVAYISYNTYPGWHIRGLIRELMNFASRCEPDPMQRVKRAREVLDKYAQSLPQTSPYGMSLKSEADFLRPAADNHVFHDYLEENNYPLYFHQFIDQAAAHDLQYLSEADLASATDFQFPPDLRQSLRQLSSSPIEHQQYLDFYRNRMFRQSLICHRSAPLAPDFDHTRLRDLFIYSRLKPQGPVDLSSNAPVAFTGPNQVTFNIAAPLIKSALTILADESPKRLSFNDLFERTSARLPTRDAAWQDMLSEFLLHAAFCDGVRLYPRPADFTTTVSERPLARPLARLQAKSGNNVTNYLHHPVALTPPSKHLILLSDGQNDRSQIVAGMVRAAHELQLPIVHSTPPDRLAEVLRPLVETDLQHLASTALLSR